MDFTWLGWAIPLTLLITLFACILGVFCWGGRQQAAGHHEADNDDE